MLGKETFILAASKAAQGRISFDCSCGRHRFWFRHLATLGGFALTPQEKAFPKIRNPQLRGCCCKHVLAVLRQLHSPTLHAILCRELERQAEAAGFVTARPRFLSPGDLRKAQVASDEKDRSIDPDELKMFRKMAAALKKLMREDKCKELQKTLRPRLIKVKGRESPQRVERTVDDWK